MALAASGVPGAVPQANAASAKGAGAVTDQAAIGRFQARYAEHHARVYAYAVSRVGRQLADEVVSEVFLVAWRRLADVPAPALPRLLTVAPNTANSQFRGTARQRWMRKSAGGAARRLRSDLCENGAQAYPGPAAEPPCSTGQGRPGTAWRAASAGRRRMRRSAWSCVLSSAWC